MADQKQTHLALQAIAVFEGFKAIVLLALGFGLLSVVHKDAEEVAEHLVRWIHLNPAMRYPRIFIDLARHVSSTEIWMVALLALVDAGVRAAAAFGLWYDRNWGKWLGIITAGLYLPIEVYEMCKHLTWLKTVAFLTNLLIVICLGLSLCISESRKVAPTEQEPSPQPQN